MKNVYSFNMSDHISQCELVVDDNVDGEDNKEGKTREVSDIRMYHISYTSGRDMLWLW